MKPQTIDNHAPIALTTELVSIVCVTFAALFFAHSPLAEYDLQVVAALFILYMLVRKHLSGHTLFYLYESLGFIFMVLLAVFSTGGLTSPFFFLVYFLLFALVLLLDATSSIIMTLLLVILFITTSTTNSFAELIPVFSLPFIAPFAHYLGLVREKYVREKRLIHQLEANKGKLERTKEYQKEQTLLFLTTTLYRLTQNMAERIANFRGDADLAYLDGQIKQLQELVRSFREYVEKI